MTTEAKKAKPKPGLEEKVTESYIANFIGNVIEIVILAGIFFWLVGKGTTDLVVTGRVGRSMFDRGDYLIKAMAEMLR
jgi:hypothetical protein